MFESDTMMIPVRCFSCGQVIADKWEEFDRRVHKDHEDAEKVLDDLKVKRYCCRRMLISNVDLIEDVMNFGRK
jgi:DNA-directed RNA polymerase subunit N